MIVNNGFYWILKKAVGGLFQDSLLYQYLPGRTGKNPVRITGYGAENRTRSKAVLRINIAPFSY
jgi:hypothetical protein